MSFFGFLAFILGPLMKLMYNYIPNFAVTMIVFTVLIRLLSLPLAISQQKNTAKMSVFQPMISEIQTKYKNNQEKQQEELMKLQQEYGYNPMSGCLPMALNMLILFGIIEVVYRPVQYILGIPADVIKTACEALGVATNNTITMQTSLIQAIHNGAAAGITTGLTDAQLASIQNFNTTFLGMDMCTVPGFQLSMLLIFPIIAAITMFLSYGITQKLSGTGAQMQGSMKLMMWGMNLMFVFYCFNAPVAFSLYYGTSNIMMIGQSFLTYKIYSPDKFKAEYEAQLAAKKAEKKQRKTVVIEEKGKVIEKEVTGREMDKLRMEKARALDAEKYANERTRPLTEAERLAEQEAAKTKRKK